MNKADGQGTRGRLSAVVANSLDTRAKTQDLAREAYQSRTQFYRLFRTVVEETPAAMRRRLTGKSSLSTGAYRNVSHGGRFGRQLQFARGVHSRFPKSISDFSQHLPAHA
jgi:AraC-like DNA-binding protein